MIYTYWCPKCGRDLTYTVNRAKAKDPNYLRVVCPSCHRVYNYEQSSNLEEYRRALIERGKRQRKQFFKFLSFVALLAFVAGLITLLIRGLAWLYYFHPYILLSIFLSIFSFIIGCIILYFAIGKGIENIKEAQMKRKIREENERKKFTKPEWEHNTVMHQILDDLMKNSPDPKVREAYMLKKKLEAQQEYERTHKTTFGIDYHNCPPELCKVLDSQFLRPTWVPKIIWAIYCSVDEAMERRREWAKYYKYYS